MTALLSFHNKVHCILKALCFVFFSLYFLKCKVSYMTQDMVKCLVVSTSMFITVLCEIQKNFPSGTLSLLGISGCRQEAVGRYRDREGVPILIFPPSAAQSVFSSSTKHARVPKGEGIARKTVQRLHSKLHLITETSAVLLCRGPTANTDTWAPSTKYRTYECRSGRNLQGGSQMLPGPSSIHAMEGPGGHQYQISVAISFMYIYFGEHAKQKVSCCWVTFYWQDCKKHSLLKKLVICRRQFSRECSAACQLLWALLCFTILLSHNVCVRVTTPVCGSGLWLQKNAKKVTGMLSPPLPASRWRWHRARWLQPETHLKTVQSTRQRQFRGAMERLQAGSSVGQHGMLWHAARQSRFFKRKI